MFFTTYPQIFIPFYLVVLAAVTFLHITESPCSTFDACFFGLQGKAVYFVSYEANATTAI